MQEITRETEQGTEWIEDIEDFENPDTLAECLRAAAADGEYMIDGLNISATPGAIAAAVAYLTDVIAAQGR